MAHNSAAITATTMPVNAAREAALAEMNSMGDYRASLLCRRL